MGYNTPYRALIPSPRLIFSAPYRALISSPELISLSLIGH
jgi:hypothetical protein